jgi:predicted RNase H-like HicB family nuclease
LTAYALYLESGPKRRKTMVHVLDLLGCIAQGATTEAAIEATPEAIRAYLNFLGRHGERVDPQAQIRTTVAAHVMQGHWLGNGDPTPGFAPDFEPLSAADLATYLKRLAGLQAELNDLIRAVPQAQLPAKPEKGRSLHGTLAHLAESHGYYLRYLVGKVDGLSQAVKAVTAGPLEALPVILDDLWQISNNRLEILTEEEREQLVPHGQVTWSAHRALRRMLEHHWEHLLEISDRLGTGK